MKTTLSFALGLLVLTAPSADAQQLLIPESTNDQVMLFDGVTGALINPNFIDLSAVGTTPIECIQGPGVLYISDQSADTVFMYSQDGSTLLGQIPTGLDNVRGIEYANDTLYVSNSGTGNGAPGDAVVTYDANLNYIGFFPAGDPFDVLDRGSELLVCDIIGEDLVSFAYDGSPLGIFHNSDGVTGIDFPEQAAIMPGTGGVIAAGFSAPAGLYEYDSIGNEVNYWAVGSGLRGVHVLPSGNIMFTNGSGVHIFDPVTGGVIDVVTGVSARFIGVYADSVGTAFCFGDGSSGVSCPCGNDTVLGAGEGCANGTGLGALITGSGMASVASDSLVLTVSQAVPSEFGIYVQNLTTGAPAPFYNGLLCLAGDSHLVRHYAPPAIQPTVTDVTGTGTNAQAMTLGDFLGDTQPGVTIHYQFWGRDNAGPCGTGANFSSGLSVVWQ